MENKELEELQQAWLNAKAEEDRAKSARLLVEELILDKIGYTEGDPNFKSWKDRVKITFSKKEEYDNATLLSLFQPQDWSAPDFPFRVKLEPDAKKMIDFKINNNEFYLEKLAPICTVKFSKPSFAKIETKGE